MSNYIIFDMDGVLVDSEPIHMEILSEVLDRFGVTISLDYYFSLVGMGGLLIWEKLKEDYSLNGAATKLYADYKEYFYRVIKSKKIPPVKDVVHFLNQLKKDNYSISLGSSSPVKLIKHNIGLLGIENYFDHLVSSEHVKNGKPFPDIFLKVAELYNVNSSQFIVIEDSHNGVLAAKAAGMKCIGYRNVNSGNQDLSPADLIIDSFVELSAYKIKQLLF